jgi:O-antigen ligase
MEAVQFEVWNTLDGGNPGGHSIVQRFAFLRAAFHIYQNYPVLGVGIGDVRQSFDWAYAELKSPLAPEFRLRAHNQFVTFLLAGGPLNLILWTAILVALAFGGYRPSDRPIQQIALLFVWVLALSCLTEDTLETQAGVTFAGFFIGLLGRRSHSQLS